MPDHLGPWTKIGRRLVRKVSDFRAYAVTWTLADSAVSPCLCFDNVPEHPLDVIPLVRLTAVGATRRVERLTEMEPGGLPGSTG